MKINLPELKKKTYKLKELAEKYGYSMSDLLDHAEEGRLQICKQRNSDVPDLFSSDKEMETPFYQNEPIRIDHLEARELEKSSRGYNGPELISLVITHDEKIRLEEKYSAQEETDSTTHPQEKYPSLIGDSNDLMVSGYKAMLLHIGGSPSNLIRRIIHESGFPLNKDDDNQPWAWKSQLQEFKRNRKRKKHKLPPRPFPTKKTK